jgi:hypothetical protein
MDFLTLHELSLQLDVSVRILRLRLHRLLAEGTLIEPRACLREGYVDATHFVWRVNPVAFMRATGYQSASRPGNQTGIPVHRLDTPPVNRAPQPAYFVPHGLKFWIITEADRSVTTILLPEDY